jgi:SAM-dependent methyltransferase
MASVAPDSIARPVSPLPRAVAAQLAGVLVATLCAAGATFFTGAAPGGTAWVIAQGLGAAACARLLRMEWWWLVLNLAFGPAIAAAAALSLPAQGSALILVVLLLAYGGTQQTRVPLYLSSRAAVAALLQFVPGERETRVLDLGCGTGTVLAALARERPLARLEGVERAPLPWFLAWLRGCLARRRFDVSWRNLWDADLSRYDVVYAYLSPAAMPRLRDKARREMRPGSLLVSFRFAIPGVAADSVPVGRQRLYLWRM